MGVIQNTAAYKFTIIYVSFFAMVALASAIGLAFEHGNPAEFSGVDWLLLGCGILINFGNTMMAFMQQHLKKYLNEYLGDDVSTHIETTETTTTVVDKPLASTPVVAQSSTVNQVATQTTEPPKIP